MNRHSHDVIDADATVIVVVERRALEFALRQQVADALRYRAGIARMLAPEWVLEEVLVEGFELALRNCPGLIAYHATVPRLEITD